MSVSRTPSPAAVRPFYVALETRGHRFLYLFTAEDTRALLRTVLEDAEREDLVLDWQDVRDVLEAVDSVLKQAPSVVG